MMIIMGIITVDKGRLYIHVLYDFEKLSNEPNNTSVIFVVVCYYDAISRFCLYYACHEIQKSEYMYRL